MSGLQPSGFGAVLTQGVALGWDMAAPLALSDGRRRNNSNDQYRGFSTSLRFGRDDRVVGWRRAFPGD